MPWGLSTASYIAIASAVASAATAAASSIQQGRAEAASAKYQADVAASNAKIAAQQSALTGAAATSQIEQAALKTRAQLGGIVTSQAAGNIDIGSGSALDVQSSAKDLGQLNALSIRSNAARTAYGFQTQGFSDTAQSQLDTFKSGDALSSSYFNAGSNVIGGVSDATVNYSKFRLDRGNSLNSAENYVNASPSDQVAFDVKNE